MVNYLVFRLHGKFAENLLKKDLSFLSLCVLNDAQLRLIVPNFFSFFSGSL